LGNQNRASRAFYQEQKQHPSSYTTIYLRKLISERPYIRAALYNHGGSIITTGASLDLEGQDVYTSQIGNDFHLDLLEAEIIVQTDMNKQQRDVLLAWADGLDEITASDLMRIKPSALRKRRQRAVEHITEKMEHGKFGGNGE
jgi:hypothetical protein